MPESSWKIQIGDLTLDEAERLSDAIETVEDSGVQAAAIDIEDEKKGLWRLEAYCLPQSDPASVAEAITGLAKSCGLHDSKLRTIAIEDEDWVARSQSDLAPIIAGRFFIHGSHDRPRRPAGGTSVEIDAAQAFGTGHHATTRGCLIALDRILKQARPQSFLDLGCGSGILAIAAARSTRRPVVAADIDPVAVRIAAENATANTVGGELCTFEAAGTKHREIMSRAPYDVVFANILARPLEMLAPEISSVLALRGRAILSGLTPDQEARVLSAYLAQGLRLEQRLRVDGWSCLTLSSGSPKSAGPGRLRSGCQRAPVRCR